MKKSLLAVALIAVVALPSFAVPKKSSAAAPAYASSSKSMAGRSAIGAGVDGVGYRHWLSDEAAFDVNFGFLSGKDTTIIDLGAMYLFLLRSTSNLHFMGMAGFQYGNNDYTTSKQTDLSFGAGLNVEYFFNELPDLGFNATLTGLSIDMRTTDFGGASTSSTIIATQPVIGFGVRYYFN